MSGDPGSIAPLGGKAHPACDQTYDSPVAVGGDERITVPRAARLLGLQLHTVYRLIEKGELGGVDTYGARVSGGPRRRRTFRLARRDVDQYLERARIKPGELRHLVPPATRRQPREL